MIPDNNDNDRKNLSTPKRFELGYFARETAELFHAGWTVASRHMLADRKEEEARETRKNSAELLELALYDKASRGDTAEIIEALKYYQRKKEFDQRHDLRAYSLGEHLTSVVHSAVYLGIVAVIFSLTANWSCGGNQTQFCKDTRAVTGGIVRYFSESK